MSSTPIPVVTLDGLSGAGKGTVGLMLAHRLGWHFLDSGVFYRLLALAADEKGIALEDADALAALALQIKPQLTIRTEPGLSLSVSWQGQEVTKKLRTETCGADASKISVYPQVRAALLAAQREFQKTPGLVADGRDMGSIVFPNASCKFFLTASLDIRAYRRYLQLKQQGNYASLTELKSILLRRDKRDQNRSIAVAQAAEDACIIDTTDLSIESVLSIIKQVLSEKHIALNRL